MHYKLPGTFCHHVHQEHPQCLSTCHGSRGLAGETALDQTCSNLTKTHM